MTDYIRQKQGEAFKTFKKMVLIKLSEFIKV